MSEIKNAEVEPVPTDNGSRRRRFTQPGLLKSYVWGLATCWTVVIAGLLTINFHHEQSQAQETARTQARSNYQRDVIYRHWNAGIGAVYVPVTGDIQPNPYLKDLPERDVTTTDGKRLTLINPAYMTRLVFDLAAQSYGVKGHITSLSPLRPENRPDEWEKKALKAFAGGEQEVSSVEKMADGSYLRLMKPLRTEEECLKCHGKQGYKVGEIRGGLSVAMPMGPLLEIARQNFILVSVSFIILWSIGIIGIFIGSALLRRTIRERDEAEQGLRARTTELETANRELDAFCSTVSHDLRSPLMVIGGFCQLIREAPSDGHMEICNRYTDIILESVRKMEKLITTLLNFSRITRSDLKRTTVDLSGIAAEIVGELRMKDQERQVVVTIAEGLVADGDEALVRVVMQNLLGNAWKYTGNCAGARIEVGTVERGGTQVYFVRDNGIGFDNSQAERIFDAFQRLDNVGDIEGTGVGLATVKRIITRHGGWITCEGEVGKGSTFYFSL